MTAWRDEHPDRYGPLNHGDYCVIQGIDTHAHFIQIGMHPGAGIWPASNTACGIPFPTEMWSGPNRYQFQMGGIVNCENCLEKMRENPMRETRT